MNSSSRNFNAFKLSSVFAAIMPKTMEELKLLQAQQIEINAANQQDARNSYFRPKYKNRHGGKTSPRWNSCSDWSKAKNHREARRAQRVRMTSEQRRNAALQSMIAKNLPATQVGTSDAVKIGNLKKVPLMTYVECGGKDFTARAQVADRFAAFKNL